MGTASCGLNYNTQWWGRLVLFFFWDTRLNPCVEPSVFSGEMKGIAESSLLAGGGSRVCLSLFNTWSNNTQPAIIHKSKSVIVFPPLLRILLTIFFSNRRHKQLGKFYPAQLGFFFFFKFKWRVYSGGSSRLLSINKCAPRPSPTSMSKCHHF